MLTGRSSTCSIPFGCTIGPGEIEQALTTFGVCQKRTLELGIGTSASSRMAEVLQAAPERQQWALCNEISSARGLDRESHFLHCAAV